MPRIMKGGSDNPKGTTVKNNKIKLITLLIILFVSPTWAVDHWQACDKDHEAGSAIGSPVLRPGGSGAARKSACYDTDGTADSPLISVGSCREVDVLVYDFSGNHDATLNWMSCPTNAVDATACEAVNGGTALTGDASAATPAFEIQGHGQNYGYVDMTANVSTRDVRVEVRCNGN